MSNLAIKNRQRRLGFSPILFFMLLLTWYSQASNASVGGEWQMVSGVTVEQGSRVYDRSSRQYYTVNTVTNTSGADLSGQLRMVVTSSTYPVTNASGTDASGMLYFNLSSTLEPVRINFKRIRASFAYTVEVQQFMKDSDGDGYLDDVDSCPNDPGLDDDNDGICGVADTCPADFGVDVDNDGFCGAADICPNDPTDACLFSINGQVLGGGTTLANANVQIGLSPMILTDPSGGFTFEVSAAEIVDNTFEKFFPVKVTAEGYATSNRKIVVVPGQTTYNIVVELQRISDQITPEDDLSAPEGVSIEKDGLPVGSLQILPQAFPAGVTEITGTITYLDPTTSDVQAGPDLLALPAGANPNEPVPLETFGMMEFDLKDQNGSEIHELGGAAEVCMQATSGLVFGDTVPLWYYDEQQGLWIEQGLGTVVDRNGLPMICGDVTHFTWWNYDRPVTEHSCFKFDVVRADDNSSLSGLLDWQAEGVSYNGTSPERACDRDANDPITTLAGNKIDSVTVKKATTLGDEKIRLWAYLEGVKFYLVRDPVANVDGTFHYSLTQDQALATVFDNPTAQGSCLLNEDVDNCAFLDYQEGPVANGIIPLDIENINLPPVITGFTIFNSILSPSEMTPVIASVTDPEGSGINVMWQTQCYSYYNYFGSDTGSGDESMSPEGAMGASGSAFSSDFTAPSALGSPYSYCEITLTATDDEGASSSASQWLDVTAPNNALVLEGILYGTDGQPMANAPVDLIDSLSACFGGDTSAITDDNGLYRFNAVGTGVECFSNNNFGSGQGVLSVPFYYQGADAIEGLWWLHEEPVMIDTYYLEFGGEFISDFGGESG